MPEQREKREKRPHPGRPPKPERERATARSITLTPDLWAFAREYGDGVSPGIRRALEEARARQQKRGGK